MSSVKGRRGLRVFISAGLAVLLATATCPAVMQAQEIQWIRQFGTTSIDEGWAVAVDGTGVYVVGDTYDVLPGQTSAGGGDAFVRKYDADGTEQWTRQFGTASDEPAVAAAVNATGVYIVGRTEGGTLPGQTSAGGTDAFVRMYDVNGNLGWTRQFGSASGDRASGVALDATGAYVGGTTGGALPGQTSAGGTDAFVRKYDASGAEQWTRQFGTESSDGAAALVAEVSGVHVAGTTLGTLPGQTGAGDEDAFVRQYDANGNEVRTLQFGSASYDYALGVAVDASGVYLGGGNRRRAAGTNHCRSRRCLSGKDDGNSAQTRTVG